MNPLETLNITYVSEITKEQFINVARNSLAAPTLILAYTFFAITLLLVGLGITKKNSRSTMFLIWFVTMIITGVFIFTLIFLPNFWYNTIETIKSWFTFG